MLYELRIYDCVPGRLAALLKRFHNDTIPLWERHGISQGGFWTTMIGENSQRLYYFLVWESLAEREQKWAAFSSDPDWSKARAESEKDGPIVAKSSNQILSPTAFSSQK